MADENVKKVPDPVPPPDPASGRTRTPPSQDANRQPPTGEAIAPSPVPHSRPAGPVSEPLPGRTRTDEGNTAVSVNGPPGGPLKRLGRWWRGSAKKNQQPADTVREVLETIVFVVVLVVLLKTFAAEAFVIPTGSMATTLLGVNREITCPKCGAKFPLNSHDEVEKKRGGPTAVEDCICYNCRYQINFPREERESNGSWQRGSLSYGDRVLVAKFLADLGLKSLQPLDVVVFKFPEEPLEDYTPKNYIKRLIGLPDQVIVIYSGDIYVAQRKDLEKKGIPFTKEEWLKNPERYGNLLEELQKYPLRRRMMRDHKDILKLFDKGSDCFHILRKPPDKILALLRPVYDNDHQAKDLPRSVFQRWAPESDEGTPSTATDLLAYVAKRRQAEQDPATWKADQDGKSFSIERSGKEIAWLRYRNLLRPLREEEGNPKQVIPVPITDFLSYNTANTQRDQKNYRWVGDLILECEVKVEKAEGELILQLSKGADRFQARWDLATGRCTLERIKGDRKPPQSISDPTLTKLSKPGTYLVRFANVDQRLTVWVDKTLPFDQGVSYQPSREQGPTQGNDLEPASIGVRGPVSLSVQKLKLGRDTYYTQGVEHEEGLTEKEWEDPQKWDTYQRGPTSFYVQPGHYFCMGDNSPASSDSRSWDKESLSTYIGGLVPERLMLGRALAIYWPISRFGRIK